MDFIVGLPRTPKGHDSIWVIIDRLNKVAHCIAMRNDYRVENLKDLYVDNILRLHGAPVSILSDQGTQYVSNFLEESPQGNRDSTGLQHRLPPSDGWLDRESELDLGGYALSLCFEIWV